MSGQFAAKPSALGYMYQVRYALYLLFQRGQDNLDLEISLETLDDITFEEDGDPCDLIQSKHHTTPGNLTDSSPDLWKTLRVWSEQHQKGLVSFQNVTLTLVTTDLAPSGSIAESLKPDQERNLSEIRGKLDHIAEISENKSLKSAFTAYLGLSTDDRELLLSRVVVIDNQWLIQDLPAQIKKFFMFSTAYPDAFYERLEGWWCGRAVELLSTKGDRLKTIPARELKNKTQALTLEFSDEGLPDDFPYMELKDKDDFSEEERVFIEQLSLVLDSNTRLKQAMGHYYQAYTQRSRWLDDGLIEDVEIDRYEDYLIHEWSLIFERYREDLEPEADDRTLKLMGRQIFNVCQDKTWNPIRKYYQNAVLARGSLHMLANRLAVGWHPQFKERLEHILLKAAEGFH